MLKKGIYSIVAVSLVLIGIYVYFPKKLHLDTSYCAFCDPKVLQYQTFYEDDLVLGLYTHKPIVPGHCLIIPKRHVERFEMLSDEEAAQMNRVIKKIHKAAMSAFNASSYLLVQKNGAEAWQTVPHVHFHYIPRTDEGGSSLAFLSQMLITNMKSPITPHEMHDAVERMRSAME